MFPDENVFPSQPSVSRAAPPLLRLGSGSAQALLSQLRSGPPYPFTQEGAVKAISQILLSFSKGPQNAT
jgi:hypothetical protein